MWVRVGVVQLFPSYLTTLSQLRRSYSAEWEGSCELVRVWREAVAKMYESVSKSFRTGRLEEKLQMVQLSATRCSCISIL
jgi:hypothetical protein